jgi:hypothetical protein
MTSPTPGSNGPTAEQIKALLAQVDECDDELASLTGEHMSNCKPARARLRDIKKEARDIGVDKNAFAAYIEDHRADRKKQARIEALEADSLESYEKIKAAMGDFADTPLGGATLDRIKPKGPDLGGVLDHLTQG